MGAPELLVLVVLAIVLGGGLITVDAVIRPATAYRTGSKTAWVALLVCANPLLTRWLGGPVWLATLPLFLIAAVTYYAVNRRGNPAPRPTWMWVAGGAAVLALLAANSAILLYALRQRAAEPSAPMPSEADLVEAPDAAALLELRDAGSDLSRPHAIAFLLFLPSEASAARVARTLRERGFAVEVKESVGGGQWQARGTRMMVPDQVELLRLRRELDALAQGEGGEYGGWRAPVVR
ncbi:ribonuclease E inhibitor RraB [bacterium]|nr:ribonuclease E inhibitor RraB [bacterium]